mgnify:CR=1 FL=1
MSALELVLLLLAASVLVVGLFRSIGLPPILGYLLVGALGMALTFPLTAAFMQQTGTLFKVFEVSHTTLLYQALAALVVGLLAAAWPAWKMSRIDIVQGLRHVA